MVALRAPLLGLPQVGAARLPAPVQGGARGAARGGRWRWEACVYRVSYLQHSSPPPVLGSRPAQACVSACGSPPALANLRRHALFCCRRLHRLNSTATAVPSCSHLAGQRHLLTNRPAAVVAVPPLLFPRLRHYQTTCIICWKQGDAKERWGGMSQVTNAWCQALDRTCPPCPKVVVTGPNSCPRGTVRSLFTVNCSGLTNVKTKPCPARHPGKVTGMRAGPGPSHLHRPPAASCAHSSGQVNRIQRDPEQLVLHRMRKSDCNLNELPVATPHRPAAFFGAAPASPADSQPPPGSFLPSHPT